MRILFVCLGNICRSPIAEGVMRKLVQARGLDWEIASVGTNRWHKGGPADARAVTICREFGLDIGPHVARRFTREDFARYDRIYSLGADIHREIAGFSRDPAEMRKVENFLDAVSPGRGEAVPDPWYDGEAEFRECYRIVERGCVAVLDALVAANESARKP